jgi:hypothetical protein
MAKRKTRPAPSPATAAPRLATRAKNPAHVRRLIREIRVLVRQLDPA